MNLPTEVKRRMRQNLRDLPCGQDNWQLVCAFVASVRGEFTMQQVVNSDVRAEQPYVAVALELLMDRNELEVVSDNRRDHSGVRYRKANSASSGGVERGNQKAANRG